VVNQGGLAVGGTLNLAGGGQWGERADTGRNPAFYVEGAFDLARRTEVSLTGGYAYLPNTSGRWDEGTRTLELDGGGFFSTAASGDRLARDDPRNTLKEAPWDWAVLNESLTAVSNALAEATATGTIGVAKGMLTFDPGKADGGIAVFNLDANDFEGTLYDADGDGRFDFDTENVANFAVNVPADMVYVINLINFDGKTVLDGVTFGEVDSERLLWNIVSGDGKDSAVTLGSRGDGFAGAVLAPMIDVSLNEGAVFTGQMAAKSYTQSGGAMEFSEFSAPVIFAAVPEPGMWGLWGLGGCVLLMAVRRRRR
jgi:choice-of-anchor A domain-containing protein